MLSTRVHKSLVASYRFVATFPFCTSADNKACVHWLDSLLSMKTTDVCRVSPTHKQICRYRRAPSKKEKMKRSNRERSQSAMKVMNDLLSYGFHCSSGTRSDDDWHLSSRHTVVDIYIYISAYSRRLRKWSVIEAQVLIKVHTYVQRRCWAEQATRFLCNPF